jgi:alpha-mannosidase
MGGVSVAGRGLGDKVHGERRRTLLGAGWHVIMRAAIEERAMRLQRLRWVWLAAGLVASGTTRVAAASGETKPEELKALWTIGTSDRDCAEFALAPDGWREYRTRFADDAVFIVGRSDVRQDWPYVHPGPADAWAGSRQHTFVVFFGLKAPPTGDCRLFIELVDTHSQAPPKWKISVNGWGLEYQMPAGAGDDSLNGKPSAGRPQRCVIPVPAAALQAGNNVLTLRSVAGSWVVYDALDLHAPADTDGAPVESMTTILGGADRPVLIQRDGQLWQQVQVSIQHTGDRADASLSVDGGPAVPVALKPGNQQIDATVPAIQQARSVKVALQVGEKTVAQQPVELKPVRQWVVYLLPHSHNDIGYTHVQTEVEKKQWEYLEQAIETARKTADYPAGARFRWNVEVMWAIDGYLRQASPEKQQAFVDAVKAGWIELDALYGNELTALCRPEELIRLVECGGQVAHRCGVPLESAMISDVPGYTWGIVSVLAQAGVKYFSVGPNPGDRIGGTLAEWGDKPFYWQSPSGQERVLCWVAGKGYAFFHGANLAKTGAEPLLAYLNQLDQARYPYDLVQLRYSVGGDNGPPDPAMCDVVRKWNDTYAYPRLVISTTSEMCRALEDHYRDQIPQFRGDFTPYWEDGAASSAEETAINRRTAEKLVQAETLYALLAPDQYPADAFYDAWRNVILYDEHTWGAWNSISEPDAPFVKDQWKIKQAFALDGHQQASDLLNAALKLRGSAAGDAAAIEVVNTTVWPRTDWVFAPDGISRIGDVVMDDAGAVVPAQRVSDGGLVFLASDVPPLASKRYTVKVGQPPATGRAKAEGLTLTNGTITVRVDPATGAIASLRAAGIENDLVDSKAGVTLNDYIYLPGADVKDAQRNGPVKVSVKEAGPFWAALLVESDAPGCNKLTRQIIVADGLDQVSIIDTIDKQAVRAKEGVHFGFGFNVPGGVVRMDIPFAVARPEADQLPGACRNWFTVQRWVDVSNEDYGVTWVTLDAPLIEIGGLTANLPGPQAPENFLRHIAPSQTIYSWVMNNHWHTNYKADQGGAATFCYVVRPHRGTLVPDEAARLAIGCSQRLIAVPAPADPAKAAALAQPRLRVSPPAVIVSSFKPSADGKALMVRLFNSTDRPASATLAWSDPVPRATGLSSPSEERGAAVPGPLEVPAWGVATLRCERP